MERYRNKTIRAFSKISSLQSNEIFVRKPYPAHNFMYYVYILKNKTDSEIYIGYSEDLRRRLKEHKSKNPELIYYEAYKSEKDARSREMKLKQHGQTKRRLKERISHSIL